jgi:hypothetical protein
MRGKTLTSILPWILAGATLLVSAAFGWSGVQVGLQTGLRAWEPDVPTVNIFNAKTCRVYRTTLFSVPNGVPSTAVPFEAAEYNDDSMWTLSDPTKIRVPVEGLYAVSPCVAFFLNSVGSRYAHILINGVGAGPILTVSAADLTVGAGIVFTTFIPLKKNDAVGLAVFQDSGAPLNMILNPGIWPSLTVMLVRSSDPTFSVVQPVSVDSTSVSLVRGDDYAVADGRGLTFTSDDWPDLTGATEFRLTARRRDSDAKLFEKTDRAASRVLGAGTQVLVFELTPSETGVLPPTTQKRLESSEAKFDVQATLDGRILTLAFGTIDVAEDQTRPA